MNGVASATIRCHAVHRHRRSGLRSFSQRRSRNAQGFETIVNIIFRHEDTCAGNISATDTYEFKEQELSAMIERDRRIRASREGLPLEDIRPRTAQAIVQELWNVEERSAHSYHRVDRRFGGNVSYEELSAADREPSGLESSPEETVLAEEARKQQHNVVRSVLDALQFLTPRQRDIVNGVFFCNRSQADMARTLGITRAAVSKQLSAALAKLRLAADVSGYDVLQ